MHLQFVQEFANTSVAVMFWCPVRRHSFEGSAAQFNTLEVERLLVHFASGRLKSLMTDMTALSAGHMKGWSQETGWRRATRSDASYTKAGPHIRATRPTAPPADSA